MYPPTPQTNRTTEEIYCWNCGKPINKKAVICVHCGVPTQHSAQPLSQRSVVGGKSKTTAVLLAVFLGSWTWVYTWKKDKAKFLICFGLSMLSVCAYIILFALIYNSAANSYYGSSDLSTYTGIMGVSQICSVVWGIAVWLWAVINSAVRPSEWYEHYGEM